MAVMEDPAGRGGLLRELRQFFAAAVRYAAARWKLAAMEGKEASGQLLKALGLAVAALVLLGFAWLFACLTVVFLLARAFGENGWIWASLVMAAAHVAGAALLALWAKAGLKEPMFPLTSEELKKDQEWLENRTKHN